VTTNEVSTLRLYLMRILFLLNFALLGLDVWPAIIHHAGAWEPMRGVAFSFWAALSALSLLGLRYPLKMLPVLLMQLLYKVIWLLAVALPLWSAVRGTELAKAMTIGIVFDLVAIPWGYVWARYVKEPGDRWGAIHARPS
jgi:hypothetical protein